MVTEPDDEEVDKARDLLLKPATEENEKGEHRDLFFFIGADVSSDKLCVANSIVSLCMQLRH